MPAHWVGCPGGHWAFSSLTFELPWCLWARGQAAPRPFWLWKYTTLRARITSPSGRWAAKAAQGSNTPASFGSFTGTGTISSTGPGFTGTFSGTAYNAFPVSGLLSGAFFGPQAAEMGYGYTLSAGGFSAVGAVAGAKQ